MSRSHHRRLKRLEKQAVAVAPTCIFSDRPLEVGETEHVLQNWRSRQATWKHG